MYEEIRKLYDIHKYLLQSDKISNSEKKVYQAILDSNIKLHEEIVAHEHVMGIGVVYKNKQ
jgi:hypothetical protein